MALTPFDDFSIFRRPSSSLFRDEDWQIFDPFREEFFRSRPGEKSVQAFSPLLTADLIETDNQYHVHCDLPGVEASDIDLSINGHMMTIKAERKHVHEHKTDKVHSLERSYGTVQRKIKLPTHADVDNVTSTFKNGVLSVTFPKVEEQSKVRKITIETA